MVFVYSGRRRKQHVPEGGIKSLVLNMLHVRCLSDVQMEILDQQLVIGRVWTQSSDLGWRNELVSHGFWTRSPRAPSLHIFTWRASESLDGWPHTQFLTQKLRAGAGEVIFLAISS